MTDPDDATTATDPAMRDEAMRSAIRAANGLRVELGRALPGPLTVAPHVALLGGVVSIHVADTQAGRLADLVRRAGLLEQREAERDRLLDLLDCFVNDGDPCSFDHHGGCQAHGYLSLEPGEKCPHAEAKELLAARPAAEREG